MTAVDRNNMYEEMFNNYNLFKYGKVLGGRHLRTRTMSAKGPKVESEDKNAYCNFKERSRQN